MSDIYLLGAKIKKRKKEKSKDKKKGWKSKKG